MGTSRSFQTVVEPLLEGLSRGRSIEDLLTTIWDNLAGVVPFNRIGVAILDESTGLLRVISCRSDGETKLNVGYAARLAGSTLLHLLETGQPRILNDLEAYLAAKPESASTALIVQEGIRSVAVHSVTESAKNTKVNINLFAAYPLDFHEIGLDLDRNPQFCHRMDSYIRSSLTLPLLAKGNPIGVMFFSCRNRDAYTEAHVAALKPLTVPIAITLEKAQLIVALQKGNEELAEANRAQHGFLSTLREEVQKQTVDLRRSEERYRTLVRLGQIVNSSLDLRQVFRSAAEEIHKLIACDRVSLLLARDPDEMQYGFALEFKDHQRWQDIPALPMPGTAAQWVLKERRARVVPSLERERVYPEDQRLFDQGYRGYVDVPLMSRQSIVGVLGVASRSEGQVAAWNVELLGEWCGHLATALDNATAYGEIAQLKVQLEEQNVYLRDEIKTTLDFGYIVGDSAAGAGCGPRSNR